MLLFQTSVLKNYLSQQDRTAVEKAYRRYSKYFLNPEIQENIRSSKEEGMPSKKLTAWYNLSTKQFLQELNKAINSENRIRRKAARPEVENLGLEQEAEWSRYFKTQQEKVFNLQNEISQTNKVLNTMIHDLYGLTEEEIAIVEAS
ncbi:hypothetical protein RQM65_17420 [Pricia sp. S334]|uniref:Transposase n=1 Tax=Pricia mediterranea TaxID=3076079 RepID=A0ABU3L9V6_9FLAO|nr:hypothetical protein [Pricia sp. S334]MDT7830452.1 hypothetical protein [Pricia sp. S334]